jgi:hypothetical protein
VVFDDGPTHSSVTVSDPEEGDWQVSIIGRDLADAGEKVSFVGSTTEPAAAGPPSASFKVSSVTGTAPVRVAFDASASSSDDGSALTYAWDFGDGSVGTGKTAEHLFATAGEYTPGLTVTDGSGRVAHFQAATIVVSAPPSDGEGGGGTEQPSQPAATPTPAATSAPTPVATPVATPNPVTGPLLGGIKVAKKVQLKSLKKGLKAVIEVKAPKVTLDLKLTTKVGKKTITLATLAPRSFGAGKRSLTLKPRASALKKLKAKKVTLTLEITARASASGSPTVVRETITLQR